MQSRVTRMVGDFEAWAGNCEDVSACVRCLHYLLEGRANYLNRPDPTLWKASDVRSMLMDVAVTRLSGSCELPDHGLAAARAYLRFLDEDDRLHPASASAKTLRREVEEVADRYRSAIVDRSRFRMAKTFYMAMREDGVDIEDDDAVDSWTAQFNDAPRATRERVLEHLLADQPDLGEAIFIARAGKVAALAPDPRVPDVPSSEVLLSEQERPPQETVRFAAVAVPAEAEVARLAARSSVLERLVSTAEWVGDGRRVTRSGGLTPPDVRALAAHLGLAPPEQRIAKVEDVPGLTETWWAVRELDLVDVRRSSLVPGPRFYAWRDRAREDVAADMVLGLWVDLFTLLEQHTDLPTETFAASISMDEWLSWTVPSVMVTLYRVAGVDWSGEVPDLRTLIYSLYRSRVGPAGSAVENVQNEMDAVLLTLGTEVCHRLDQLVEHGAVELYGPAVPSLLAPPRPGEDRRMRALRMATTPGVMARLTPLGRWVMREALLDQGAAAPETPSVDVAALEQFSPST